MMKNRKYGFTLVELLAVIVILAVILVIAVPKVMNIINDTKKSTFANSVKLIASGAEQRYAENKVLGKNEEINCESIAKLSSSDYKLCEIAFEKDEARVTVVGSGKFDGLSVVYATKTNAEVQTGTPERLYTFDEVYALIDGMNNTINELKNETTAYKEIIEGLKENIKNNTDKINSLGDGIGTEDIENLQTQINETNNKVNKNVTDISNVLSKANSNATSISNLTSKANSNNIFLQTYPVGSIYISSTNTNPGTKFGGTWVAFGAGRTLVGVDSSQTEFATVGKTGGAKTHTLTINEMPTHNHLLKYSTDSGETYNDLNIGIDGGTTKPYYFGGSNSVSSFSSYKVKIGENGSSQPHNNLQPYITVYMWKRTA